LPTHTVTLNPGVNIEYTPSLNSASLQSTQLIRFSPSGLPEKIGGWTKFYPNAIDSPVTAMHAWEDLSDVLHLAIGATEQLGVITNGVLADITPQTNATNPVPNFSTTINSNIVTIVDVGSQTTIYDVVIIETQVSVGGLILFGAYAITTVESSDEYQIQAVAEATSTVS